jgi:hypothetical protein
MVVVALFIKRGESLFRQKKRRRGCARMAIGEIRYFSVRNAYKLALQSQPVQSYFPALSAMPGGDWRKTVLV